MNFEGHKVEQLRLLKLLVLWSSDSAHFTILVVCLQICAQSAFICCLFGQSVTLEELVLLVSPVFAHRTADVKW